MANSEAFMDSSTYLDTRTIAIYCPKTAKIKYDRKEVNRKLNKILLHELTIDASLETEIELLDGNEPHDLIGRVSFGIIFFWQK